MTNRNPIAVSFPRSSGRAVEASFEGGFISSDGGAMLLRQMDQLLGLSRDLARAIGDPRREASCDHTLEMLLRQRLFALALGYEDLNDHESLRRDPLIQTAVGRDVTLAHPSTLCRLEQRADPRWCLAAHEVLVDKFIASFRAAPKELILDFDGTNDPLHGEQEGRHFSGYYDEYCFTPLYVFCGTQLLVAYLRPANRGSAFHAAAVLKLLSRRLRQAWPDVRLVARGDSAFSTPLLLGWCDRNDIDYVIGFSKNPKIVKLVQPQLAEAKKLSEANKAAARVYDELQYKTGSWRKPRRVIVKAEHLPGMSTDKPNPRFVVTTLDETPQVLYEQVYCARGDMENRIKEQQLDLFADRTSCHRWWPNQWRLLLSGLAYTLIETLRRTALVGTTLAGAYCSTIRLRLLKIGAVVLRNSRRVRLLLSSAFPLQEMFAAVARRLTPTTS